MLGKVFIPLLNKKRLVFGAIFFLLVGAIAFQYQQLQVRELRIDRLQLNLEQCVRANESAQKAVEDLLDAQSKSRRERDAALQKQNELIQQLGEIDEQIIVTSEDDCANQPVPDDIRLRLKASN